MIQKNLRHFSIFIFALLLSIGFSACKKKEITNKYVFGIDKVTIRPANTDKPNVKSTTEFISITYSDLFGSAISNSILIRLSTAYVAFGDKKLVENIIISNFLNSSAVVIPNVSIMRADPEKFAEDCYKKFYTRYPTEYEKWYLGDMITNDAAITPEDVYYAFLTSNEYRYY